MFSSVERNWTGGRAIATVDVGDLEGPLNMDIESEGPLSESESRNREIELTEFVSSRVRGSCIGKCSYTMDSDSFVTEGPAISSFKHVSTVSCVIVTTVSCVLGGID